MPNELAGLTSPLEAINYVQQQGQQGKLNRLAELARQSYSVAPEQQNALLGDMAEVSPQFAAAQQKQFQGQDDRRMQKLGGAARYLQQARNTGNPAWVQGAWNSVRPMLQHEIPDANYPEQWDDATMAPTLYQALALTGGMGNGKVHSNHIGSDGYIYNVYSDGRIESTGVKAAPSTQIVKTADGHWMAVNKNNGPAGAANPVHADGFSPYDQSAGQQTYPGADPAGSNPGYQQAPAPSSPGGYGQSSTSTNAPGVSVDIGGLGPERNQQLASMISAMRQQGVTDEVIDHAVKTALTVQRSPQASAPSSQVQPVGGLSTGLTPESFAKSVAQPNPGAREESYQRALGAHQADIETLPVAEATRSQFANQREQAKSEIRNREDVEKQRMEFEKQLPQLNNLERGFDRLKAAMDKIHQHPFFGTGPMTGWFLRGTNLGNELMSARDSILNSYMALTRIAGSGAVSDKDMDTIKNQLPSLENFSDANYKTLNQLQSTIKDYKQRVSSQGASSQGAPGQSVPVTNPKGKLTDKEILKLYGY